MLHGRHCRTIAFIAVAEYIVTLKKDLHSDDCLVNINTQQIYPRLSCDFRRYDYQQVRASFGNSHLSSTYRPQLCRDFGLSELARQMLERSWLHQFALMRGSHLHLHTDRARAQASYCMEYNITISLMLAWPCTNKLVQLRAAACCTGRCDRSDGLCAARAYCTPYAAAGTMIYAANSYLRVLC